ncbi:unnamed protein product, partial [Iphiclides podalirius]
MVFETACENVQRRRRWKAACTGAMQRWRGCRLARLASGALGSWELVRRRTRGAESRRPAAGDATQCTRRLAAASLPGSTRSYRDRSQPARTTRH